MIGGGYLAGILVGAIIRLWLWPKWKTGQIIRQTRPVSQFNRNEEK